ncbi:MAG: hypothetical protein QM723_06550 [Myxococcaceae bacterium]
MKRALLVMVLLAGCHKKAAVDAGTPVEETPDAATTVVQLSVIDARIVVDAGVEAPRVVVDAGAPDAGPALSVEDAGAVEDAPEAAADAEWIVWDGGAVGSNGVTDYVTLKVGATKRIGLPINTGVVCDDLNVVEVKTLTAAYELSGKAPGTTHCKFKSMTVLGRYFEITVRP